MASILGVGYSAYPTFPAQPFEANFKEHNFVMKDKSSYHLLREQFSRDFDEFKNCFSMLQHFPEFPYVDEGIETCIVNIFRRSIEKAHLKEENGYVGQGTLQDIPYRNEFLRNLILNICDPLAFYSDNLHVGIKFHRRKIEKGNESELKGLNPHKDYDSSIIVMMKIEQKNISGGRNQITNESRDVLIEDSISEAGSFIYVNNEKLFHELTPMHLINFSESGYRDVMILEIKKAE